MCVVSNIGDGYQRDFPERWPKFPMPPWPPKPIKPYTPIQIPPEVSKEDFEKLRREIEELKKLLQAGKKFDEATGQKHCEMDAKVQFIKEIAKCVGVDLGDVFEQKK